MLDMDDAGQAAVDGIAKMIKAGKCFVANMPGKDANEVLMEKGATVLLQSMWRAQEWSPSGILTGESDLGRVYETSRDRVSTLS